MGPLGCNYQLVGPRADYGAWYMKDKKPILPTDVELLEVGHCGFVCQIITRELFDRVSIIGKNNECRGNFDWQFCKECDELGVPLMVDLSVNMWHRRMDQYDRVKEFKQSMSLQQCGYTEWIHSR